MKTQKGITLIALIITIIVMLILVGVSVSVALNTGLFKTAQGVSKNTQLARNEEIELSNGAVNIGDGKTYESIDKYIESLKGEDGIKLAEIATHKLYFDNEIFLINEHTTWNEVILKLDENRFIDGTVLNPETWTTGVTWKKLIEQGQNPMSLMVDIEGTVYGIYQSQDEWQSGSTVGWGSVTFSGGNTIKVVESAPDSSANWWCGPASSTMNESYSNAEFIIKLEEI